MSSARCIECISSYHMIQGLRGQQLRACCAAAAYLRLIWVAAVQVFAVPQTQTSLTGLTIASDQSSATFELVVPALYGTGNATFGHAQVTSSQSQPFVTHRCVVSTRTCMMLTPLLASARQS